MSETLRVFVAGATGVLGRRLVEELAERGHIAIGLSRDEAGDEVVANAGGVPRRGDVLDRDSLEWAIGDADVVVNAATAIPTAENPTEAEWERNDRVRQSGTKNLTIEAGGAHASRFVQASVVWVARKDSGGEIDEFTPPNPDRRTHSALDAERSARAARKFGLQPATLRTGWFYSHDSHHTRQFASRLLAGRMAAVGGGLLGRKSARLSFVHPNDAATAFADACEHWERGTYHVVDDEPATFPEFLRALATRLDERPPRRLPGWLARFAIGKEATRFLTTGFPTDNEPFKRTFDWEPDYPSYREGLDQVVEAWLEAGTLVETTAGYEWQSENGTTEEQASGRAAVRGDPG